MLGTLVALSGDKTGGNQLFQYAGTGSGSAKSLAFCIFRGVISTGGFHCSQQAVFGVVLGRRGFSLFQRGNHRAKLLSLFQFRVDILALGLFLVNARTNAALVGGFRDAPAHLLDGLALGSERDTFACQLDGGFFPGVWIANGTQQPDTHHLQNVRFSNRKRSKIAMHHALRGDDGMVIGYLAVINHLSSVHRQIEARRIGKYCCNSRSQLADHRCHLAGEKAAVRARIGKQLLFIQRLGIVQRLLSGVAKQAVCVTLQGGQIVELGRIFRLLLGFNGLYHRRLQVAELLNPFRFRLIRHALRMGKEAAADLHGIERFCLKAHDSRFPADDQRQRGRHNAAYVQCGSVHQGEKPGGIDTYQPVSLCSA